MNNSILNMDILADYSIAMNYNIPNLPIYVSKEQLIDFTHLKTAPHWNEGLEIVYIKKGNMYIVENGSKLLVNEGFICIINSGCLHFFESIDNNNCQYICYVFEKTVLSSANSIMHEYINPLFHAYHPDISILNSIENVTLAALLEKIYFYSIEKQPAYELYISGLLNIFVAELYKSNRVLFNESVHHHSKLDDSMLHMLSYIHQHYNQDITLETLCKAGQISRTGCFTLFKKYTGDTPTKYILKFRLSVARKQLSSTNIPIAQIASNCGFAHQSHFTSHFTQCYGITPLHYRKKRGIS